MLVEIERKFLIRSDGWRSGIIRSRHVTDYLIAKFESGKARIRVCDQEATLTFKGQRNGLKRSEYHIPLDAQHAQAMVREFVTGAPIEKDRHDVEVAGILWQVDEYRGRLSGFVTADVELPSEDHSFVVPDWAGREVTHDARFGSSAMNAAADIGDTSIAALFELASEGRQTGMDTGHDAAVVIYTSSNGDRWLLVQRHGRQTVRHEPNESSGGQASEVALSSFLASQKETPQGKNLMLMI